MAETPVPVHMTAEEFRRHGRAAVDWIADYWGRVESLPVRSPVSPGWVREQLPPAPPQAGESFDAVLADLDTIVVPALTHWQHPGFFAYFPTSTSGPAVLAELLASGLSVQGMLWQTSPACTELEQHVLDWLAGMLALPEKFTFAGTGGGVIQDSASSAILVALVAALHRISGGEVARDGVERGRYAVYTSTQANSALEKGVRITGLGASSIRFIETRPDLSMDPDLLRESMKNDVAQGIIPVMVMATVGTTSTGAVDPVESIGRICQEFGVWLHVDAAYAGVAAVCPEFRWIHQGVGAYADSYATNPHKWLLTAFDCDACYIADREALVGALSVLPEYLRNTATDAGAVVDYRDWQVPLGRRFRALKLWAVIRCYGVEGLRAHLRHSVALAQEFAAWVSADERFELIAPHRLSLVCFRLRGADEPNQRLLESLNASGRIYLSHTVIRGAFTLRLAIGGTATRFEHVAAAWDQISRSADVGE
ncbi:aminotransferase class V-fold PLP-dependent enzyme [Nocardia sp. NBC_01503]|uniref:aminotransferase class V-fold PLP-dependent enzyme n=1 Tax=Nocardia sp. NBC_01503 TaxID=2975997 RepID=UPI002E7B0F68|nr:aminotransferase class V-fold PLP-dependent enzyme [Nocardia sp. NBC_01503]WTL30769.1 aminotransferase class V-fold PLP-dependent enzyme [Nocardia sp. NBC_01503]